MFRFPTICSTVGRMAGLFLAYGALCAGATKSGLSTYSSDPLSDLVAEVRARLAARIDPAAVSALDADHVLALLTPAERLRLATDYLRFHLDVPARVTVFVDARLAADGEPFWLEDLGFRPAEGKAEAYQCEFVAWEQTFPAGEVGLGIHAFRRFREHYFVAVGPATAGAPVPTVTPLGDPRPEVAPLHVGTRPWLDRASQIEQLSPGYDRQMLVQTWSERRPLAAFTDYFRVTDHPATERPDQIVLTLTEDPARRIAVQWRTVPEAGEQRLEYWPVTHPADRRQAAAQTISIEAPRTLNQPAVARHSVVLEDLAPASRYAYRVGDGATDGWSSTATFATAPAGPAHLTFIAFGDVQEGYSKWAGLLEAARRIVPDPAFAVFAGDLVSRGNDTDDWDAFFATWGETGRSLPLLPAMGNHELLPGDHAHLYRQLFTLPTNGPAELAPERAYALTYAGHRFVILDTNTDEGQTAWLARELSHASRPRSTFVIAHHGAFTSRPGRYYARVAESWAPLMIEHAVGLVLQGHDHAYLRTIPMGAETATDPGTTFLIATAGGKFYKQAEQSYAARAFPDTPTFQVISTDPAGGYTLVTYDADGVERDRYVHPPRR